MKHLILILLAVGLLSCADKEIVIQKYDNGQKKVTYEILKGTKENPVDFNYKAYYDNGVLMKEGQMINMREDGEWKYYFNSGRINSVGQFSNGLRIGEFKRYYESGEVEQKGEYVNGEIGTTTFYYRNGTVKKEPIDVTSFILDSPTTWTESQRNQTILRCNQVLQFDYKNSNEFCKCIVDSTSRYVEFNAMDTLSDYDKSLIYQVFMQAGACDGLFY